MWKRNIHPLPLLNALTRGIEPETQWVPWQGVELVTLWSIGWCSNQLSHTGWAVEILTMRKNTIYETNSCLKEFYMQQIKLVNWKTVQIENIQTEFLRENKCENRENAKEKCGTWNCTTSVTGVRKERECVKGAISWRNMAGNISQWVKDNNL